MLRNRLRLEAKEIKINDYLFTLNQNLLTIPFFEIEIYKVDVLRLVCHLNRISGYVLLV